MLLVTRGSGLLDKTLPSRTEDRFSRKHIPVSNTGLVYVYSQIANASEIERIKGFGKIS